ncbi:MAG: FHA domain-containing protein [Magnetococcus sp. DMHC-6]
MLTSVTETQWSLIDIKGNHYYSIYPIEFGLATIGRLPDNTIFLEDRVLSRHHARIDIQEPNGPITLVDLGSANGTMLHGKKILAPCQLSFGDVITFGANTELKLLTTKSVEMTQHHQLFHQHNLSPGANYFNREYFDFTLNQAIRRKLIGGQNVSLIKMSVDRYTDLKKEHGPLAMTTMKALLAKIVTQYLATLKAKRYIFATTGEEELAIMLLNQNIKQSMDIGLAIIEQFNGVTVNYENKKFAPRLIFGVASVRQGVQNVSEIHNRVDSAINNVRNEGSDHTLAYFSEPTHNLPIPKNHHDNEDEEGNGKTTFVNLSEDLNNFSPSQLRFLRGFTLD